MLRRGLGIIISIGRWGGCYKKWSSWGCFRLCLGWIALTVILRDGDDVLLAASKYGEMMENKEADNAE